MQCAMLVCAVRPSGSVGAAPISVPTDARNALETAPIAHLDLLLSARPLPHPRPSWAKVSLVVEQTEQFARRVSVVQSSASVALGLISAHGQLAEALLVIAMAALHAPLRLVRWFLQTVLWWAAGRLVVV